MLDFTIIGFLVALLPSHPAKSPMDTAWVAYTRCTQASAHEVAKHPGDPHTLAIIAENSCEDSLVAYGMLLERTMSKPEFFQELQSIRQKSIHISETQIEIERTP